MAKLCEPALTEWALWVNLWGPILGARVSSVVEEEESTGVGDVAGLAAMPHVLQNTPYIKKSARHSETSVRAPASHNPGAPP